MTDKVTLANVGALVDTTTAATTINNNFAAIVAEFDNTLSRDGTQPNPMNANLDMNSNRILNLPGPSSPSEPLRLADLSLINGGGGGTISTLPAGGSTGQVLTKNSVANFDASWLTIPSQVPNASAFGGRLTIASATPVLTSDIVGSQTLYYAPYSAKSVPTYTSGAWSVLNFTSNSLDQVGLSLNLSGSANWAANTLHDVFAVMNGGTLQLGTRLWDSNMLPTSTQITNNVATNFGGSWTTPTNAFNGTTSQSSAVCATLPAAPNGFTTCGLGQDWGVGNTNVITKVIIYGPTDDFILGTAPAVNDFGVFGSNDNVTWHLITIWRGPDNVVNTTFTIPLSISEQQPYRYHRVGFGGNGAQSVRVAQIQFFKTVAPVTRRLTHQDGILVNDASMTVRVSPSSTITTASGEGVYLGTIHIDTATAGQITAHTTYGPSRTYGVWNMYNRLPLKLQVGTYYGGGSLTGAYNGYVPNTSQFWNECESGISGSSFHGQILCGMPEESVNSELIRSISLNTQVAPASYECGIAFDTTLNFSGTEGSCNVDTSGTSGGYAGGFAPRAYLTVPPFVGLHTLYAIERQGNNGTGGQFAQTGPRSTSLNIAWRG